MAAKKPNIVVIWGDDIGWFNISAYNRGMMGYRTPNIDRIANEGVLFTDAYAQQSCTAGRAAFVTGQSPIRTGLLTIGMPVRNGEAYLADALESLLAQSLSDLELIVSDNGSTEGTEAIVRSAAERDPRLHPERGVPVSTRTPPHARVALYLSGFRRRDFRRAARPTAGSRNRIPSRLASVRNRSTPERGSSDNSASRPAPGKLGFRS